MFSDPSPRLFSVKRRAVSSVSSVGESLSLRHVATCTNFGLRHAVAVMSLMNV